MIFQQKSEKGPERGNIRLPRRTTAPTLADLQDMINQAQANMGRDVVLVWPESAGQRTFSITAKFERGKDHATWYIWEDNGNESNMVWTYSDMVDLDLIVDVIRMLDSSRPSNISQSSYNSSSIASPSISSNASSPTQRQAEGQPSVYAAPQNSPQAKIQLSGQFAHFDPENAPPPPSDSFAGSKAAAAFYQLGKAINTLTGMSLQSLVVDSESTLTGDFSKLPLPTLLQSLAMAQLTGKLEVISEEGLGNIFFVDGVAVHATTSGSIGDLAIVEIVSRSMSSFRFTVENPSTLKSIQNRLEKDIMDGVALLDQRKHLKELGLTDNSMLVRKFKELGDEELKVMLIKADNVAFATQAKVYHKIGAKCSFADLLRDCPMESSLWTQSLFNFVTCGLLEIKPPEGARRDLFAFLGEAKSAVEGLSTQLIRPETGIFTYPAFLYFLQYEFYRYEAYGWPVSIILMEMSKITQNMQGGLDLVSREEMLEAAKRIALVKRPLDLLAHYETLNYALLLPNTTASSTDSVANQIMQTLQAVPLSEKLTSENLHLAFGIASIPADGEDIENCLLSAKAALAKAKSGHFPIVLAKSLK